MMWRRMWMACLLMSVGLFGGPAGRAKAHSPSEAMADAATHFLASLDRQQREKVQFTFEHQERLNWQFVPMERAGLSLKEMKPSQQHLAVALLNSALSHRGLSKALNIMALEQILHEMEDNSPRRDPDKYHVFIFGEPSTSHTWGWRFEGHHLSVSVTLVDGKTIAPTPLFMGTNPANVKQGPQEGLRVLNAEEDLGKAFLRGLDAQQRAKAVISPKAPDDVLSLPGRDATRQEPVGISGRDLRPEQRDQLATIIAEYVNNYRPEVADEDLKKIREAGIENLTFAWAGGDQTGEGSYYRVQGPTFIMEYDNTQNNANHVHVVWRDFQNDFGADLLKQHYEAVPHK